MESLLPLGSFVIALGALVVLVHGLVRRHRLRRALDRAWKEIPRDAGTGLFDRRVCLQRIAAELKRAGRGGGTVWVGVVTVLDGDPDRFGRLFHDTMRLPEVGFRIGERVVCIARPDLDPAARDDLLGRVLGAAPRERLAIGETIWRGPGDGDATRVLRAASEAVREVEVP